MKLCGRATRRSHRLVNACQSPTTTYPDPGTPVWQRAALATAYGAITHWIGFLARSSCACRIVWSAVATLPRQPCSQSGACHAVDLLVTGMPGMIVTIILPVINEITSAPTLTLFPTLQPCYHADVR
ncbi:MAG: hypothetical protein KatS3mg056_3741 [Chloroflexus sp.]|nr:MAG: hypothetical protein KatS3mg056_3741 [Chloroflexus sp.]